MGHDKGLSRYDGNSFTHYTAASQQGKSISNIMEYNGSVWCQDFSGNFYYTHNDSLVKETNFKSIGTYSPAGIINNRLLAVVNYDSIRVYDATTRKQAAFVLNGGRMPGVLHNGSQLYFITGNRLLLFNGSSITAVNSFTGAMPNLFFLTQIKNSIYGFTSSSYPYIYRINGSSFQPVTVLKPGLVIHDVTIIDEEIWVSTSSGAYCFDASFNPLYNGHCFFAEHSLSKVMKDKENNYWFGTLNKGVLVVPDINTKIYRYGNENITALSRYKNTSEILAGTSSNLIFSFNSNTEKINTLVSNEIKGEVFSLYYDADQNSIVSCGNKVSVYKNEQKVKEETIAGKIICAVNNGSYAVAYASGVLFFPRAGNALSLPSYFPVTTDSSSHRTILIQGYRGRCVFYDTASQTLYTGTAAGLQYFSPKGNGFILLTNKHIYASAITMVNNSLYAATFTDGLVKVQDGKAISVNKNQPAVLNTIYKLVPQNNFLWLTGDEQIQRLNTIDNTVTSYTAADGMPTAEIKDIVVQAGNVFVATSDGLVVFAENKNSTNNVRPGLLLNRFWVNDKLVQLTDNLQLRSAQNNIQINFSVLAFKGNAAAVVQYCINKGGWQQLAKNSRSLQLASLSPGKYVIEIKAFNEDGVAAAKTLVVQFTIAAPFYKQPWFIIAIAVLLFGSMYIYFRQRLQNEKKNNELLAQKMELEQELHQSMLASIKSQMNPHFLFNALNTIQSYIYTNEKENASQYLGKFSELTRMILNMSNKEKVSLADEIKTLQLYLELEQLRFEEKLNYSITVDKELSTETFLIPSMLVQPYVENAIKHGLMHQKNKWQLHIDFTQKQNAVEITIDDNGVGRQASEAINRQKTKTHQSFASNANQKRLAILNKGLKQAIALQVIDKKDANGQAAGTAVILNIPR
ncbi:MAG: histidine kinase [Ferruginibacter sp.]|nr:histidine kinase [Ferruginibacter sp.]